ncbi:winged helix-turn-helix domain-containing protein [Ruicaihuangia caeni]|uniref:Winged helix-turn-helix domain-containing protein n=1 Tax=Ruicaihuangia caeni TaxID=3042517 RepID=A0AAW6T4J1_9MICO|nr:winged helix-turn-helix domain-containing protein [Klugiella sp. YN-L-19]MDI2098735.1 winged helix-turn-helix domain-containing protein [Klugiella sp. YN-L-19]
MARVLVLSNATDSPLPSLELLGHAVRTLPADTASLPHAAEHDVVVIDARADLPRAKVLCKVAGAAASASAVLAVFGEAALAAVQVDWQFDDLVLTTASPGELDARLRLAVARAHERGKQPIQASGVVIDETSYSAKVRGEPLDLTFKEFELLRFLAANPSRVFTREQLLSEVWGYDYFGGTRTVDVHVRRLRAKLGDLESLIGTVRNVGYRFNVTEMVAPEGGADGSATG